MATKVYVPKMALNTDIILDAFQLIKHTGNKPLNHWLTATGELTDWQKTLLAIVYQKSLNRIGGWNEEELKMKLVSFIFLIADIDIDGQLATFFERPLSATINKKNLTIICDCFVATPLGFNTPRSPYFFLQEFKKGKGDQADPEGQMLGAMLIAQLRNNDGKPIYGAWLTGSIWFFTILQDKNYYMSTSFDASNETELLQIVFILRKLKDLILNR